MIPEQHIEFPFTAICGQEEFKRGLVLCAVDPAIGGLLAFGDRGTGKSTTVRALTGLFQAAGIPTPVVTLPLGATEDRVIGSIDIEAALVCGERRFAPGLLAAADRGFLYVDEINLLDDFLVDVLLDVAASGINVVEREGISHQHPARFVLVGSGNPEEGELRPQLEDRFGLSVHVSTVTDPMVRAQIIERRLAHGDDPAAFHAEFEPAQRDLGQKIVAAREHLRDVAVPPEVLSLVVRLCLATGAVGHRGELVLTSAARAAAALDGQERVRPEDVAAQAAMVLRHRVPREPFDSPVSIDERIAQTVSEVL